MNVCFIQFSLFFFFCVCFFSFLISFPCEAPVFGNFTEEDANSVAQSQDNSIEYPLQRDEVQTTPNKGERNHVPQSEYNILKLCLFFFFVWYQVVLSSKFVDYANGSTGPDLKLIKNFEGK
jgi:hypothetical protein